MKIVWVSPFADDTVCEHLHAEHLHPWIAKWMIGPLEDSVSDYSRHWPQIKPDDYVLWRGMADLVGDVE